jgi:predicted enzyme related to lactoylglutathione lyase
MDPVVHFELPYEDAHRIARFYESAFGWETHMLGEDMGHYVLATTALSDANREGPGGAINGGFYPKKADWPAQHPSIVIAVADITASMTKVAQAGGEVLGDPMRIPGIGLYVSFFDTEGNRGSLLEADPRESVKEVR